MLQGHFYALATPYSGAMNSSFTEVLSKFEIDCRRSQGVPRADFTRADFAGSDKKLKTPSQVSQKTRYATLECFRSCAMITDVVVDIPIITD